MTLLLEAVDDVTNWHGLGLRLGLTMTQLRKLEIAYRGDTDRLKAEMFDVWLDKSPNATWGDLITALKPMGKNKVVSDIEAVYSPETSNGILLCVVS